MGKMAMKERAMPTKLELDEKLIEERFFYDPKQMTGPKAQPEISEQRAS